MKTICLVEAGDYVLGIDASVVTRRLRLDELAGKEPEYKVPLIALSSFFRRHDHPLSWSEFFVLEVKTGAEPLALLVDEIVGDIKASGIFKQLPMLYPELARSCCPQIMIHNKQPVLLLDAEGLDGVRVRLKNTSGVFSMETVCGGNSMETLPEDASLEDSSGTEVESVQDAAALDDATFKTIVYWTMGEYLERGCDENRAIRCDELPSDYLNALYLRGMKEEFLQRLIDKTTAKCGKFQADDLQRLRKNSGVVKP